VAGQDWGMPGYRLSNGYGHVIATIDAEDDQTALAQARNLSRQQPRSDGRIGSRAAFRLDRQDDADWVLVLARAPAP
jgi:hypothetical protein